jgi:hypothetical protein
LTGLLPSTHSKGSRVWPEILGVEELIIIFFFEKEENMFLKAA